LFPPDSTGGRTAPARLPVSAWLVPATCALLLFVFVSLARHDQAGFLAVSAHSNFLASVSLSNQNFLPYYAEDRRDLRRNVWSMQTPIARPNSSFDWTKTRSSLSTTGSFPNGKTNLQKF
jgi:hypothetical protein